MPKPKIALVPVSQGVNFLSVLPSNGDGDFTFQRTSAATRINAKGLIEVVPTGICRLNYDIINGVVQECPSHILEPAATNLVPYSEDFTEWNNVGGNTITSGFLAPDGTNNAFKIAGTGFVDYNTIANNSRIRSIYARTVSGTGTAQLCSHNANTNNTFTITEDWQRFDVNGTTSINSVLDFFAVDFRGSGSLSEIILFAAQLEDGNYATTYIPTSGTSVTRAEENAFGCGNASIFNDSQGVLYLESKTNFNDGSFRTLSLTNLIANQYIRIFYINNNTQINITVSGTGLPQTLSLNIPEASTFLKIAVKYIVNNVEVYINGALAGTITNIQMPNNLASLDFDIDGATPFYGKTREVQYFDTILPASKLIELTTLE
jgi:hypothetical protein